MRLLEINPLVVTADNRVLPLDCKMSVDDNALYRRKALAELRDDSQIDAKEAAANAANVNYVALDGNIGCMVNGAGLAMATMDLIQLDGGKPANFLDVGGGATPETRGGGLQDHPARPQRARDPGQHLRRHRALRRDRRGHHRGGEGGRREGAGDRAAGRHQRRTGRKLLAESRAGDPRGGEPHRTRRKLRAWRKQQ